MQQLCSQRAVWCWPWVSNTVLLLEKLPSNNWFICKINAHTFLKLNQGHLSDMAINLLIPHTNMTRDLGMNYGSKLLWKEHIKKTLQNLKCRKHTGWIFAILYFYFTWTNATPAKPSINTFHMCFNYQMIDEGKNETFIGFHLVKHFVSMIRGSWK